MNDKFHHHVVIILLVLTLITTGCGAPTAEVVVVTATNEAATEISKAPPRMPPPGVEDAAPPTAEPTVEATTVPVPVASTGNVESCRLPAAAFTNVGLGIPRQSGFVPSTGTVEAVVLFVDFTDAPANETPEQTFGRVSPGAPDFFNKISYGRMTLDLQPHLTWLRLSQPSAHYAGLLSTGDGHLAFIQEAVNLADPNVDFSQADLVVVLANPEATAIPFGPAFGAGEGFQGINADGVSIPSGVTSGADLAGWGYLWLNHEMGHTLTLPDLYAFDYDGTVVDNHRFTGNWGMMGKIDGRAPEFFAVERWQLGWLEDGQIVCQTGGEQTTELSAIEQAGGTKAVMVPTGDTSAIVVESRRAIGFDTEIIKEGALVHIVDTSVESGYGPIQVFPAGDKEDDPGKNQSPLAEGESITLCNVTITNIAERDDGDTVQVTIPEVIQCEGKPSITTITVQQATPVTIGAGIPPQTAECSVDKIPAPKQGDVTIRFVNASGYEAVGFWEDRSKSPPQTFDYFNLKNGGAFIQESPAGDKWIIKDPTGGILMEYTASDDERQCVLIKRPLGTRWVDFINQSGVPAIGYLVDANGNLVEYFRVGVGGVTGLWTSPGLTWRVLDRSGNVLLDYPSTNAPEQQAVIPPLKATPVPQNTKAPPPTNTPAPTATSILVATIPVDQTNCPKITGATKVVCYDIQGSTETELEASLLQQSPIAPSRSSTIPYYSWNWDGRGTSQCNLSTAKVNIETIEITMPRWNPPANASPALVVKWEQYLQILAIRVQARVDFFNANYLEIRTAIQNAGTCSTADVDVKAQNAVDLLDQKAGDYAEQIQPLIAFP